MSPAFTLPVAALFYGLFWLLAGFLAAAPLFAGLALGYLAYETVHFLVHTGQFRRLGLMRQWRRYHLGYHYRDDTVAYGVTTPALGLRLRHPPPLILPLYSSYPLNLRIQMLR